MKEKTMTKLIARTERARRKMMTYAELGFEFLVPDEDGETTYIKASGRLRRADPSELAQLIAARTGAHPESAKILADALIWFAGERDQAVRKLNHMEGEFELAKATLDELGELDRFEERMERIEGVERVTARLSVWRSARSFWPSPCARVLQRRRGRLQCDRADSGIALHEKSRMFRTAPPYSHSPCS
jgi:hypothetical protein